MFMIRLLRSWIDAGVLGAVVTCISRWLIRLHWMDAQQGKHAKLHPPAVHPVQAAIPCMLSLHLCAGRNRALIIV